MTAVQRRPATVVRQEPVPVVRRIVDAPDVARARLSQVQRTGRVVSHTEPRRLADGRHLIDVTLLPATRTAPPRSYRWVSPTVLVTALAGFAAAVVWMVARLAAWVVDHLATIVGAVVVGALLVWWLTHGRNGCPGIHCSGCRG